MAGLSDKAEGRPQASADKSGRLANEALDATQRHQHLDSLAHYVAATPAMEKHGAGPEGIADLALTNSKLGQAFNAEEEKKNGNPNKFAADLQTHLRSIPGHEKDTIEYEHNLVLTLANVRKITVAEYNGRETLARRSLSPSSTPEQTDDLAKSIAGLIQNTPDSKENRNKIANAVQAHHEPWDLIRKINDYLKDGLKLRYTHNANVEHFFGKDGHLIYGATLDKSYPRATNSNQEKSLEDEPFFRHGVYP